MRVRRLLPLALTLGLLIVISLVSFVQHVVSAGNAPASQTPSVRQLPISFEVNQGQAESQVRFLAHGPGYTLFLTPQEALLALSASKHTTSASNGPGIADPSSLVSNSASTLVGMQLLNAHPQPKVTGEDPLPGIVNYLLGNNPATWRTNIPTFAQVRYHGIYPGVDLLYDGTQGHLEYDFLVAPGSDPSQIHLNFTGVDRLSVDAQGELLLHLPAGALPEAAPRVYQEINGVRQQIASSYVLQSATEVGFQLGIYDASKPLVIDPTILFSTYLGGLGNDESTGLAVDSQGNSYITGATSSTNFPAQNALQATSGGGPSDAFVTKITAAGTALVYSTYLGGSGADWGTGIAVDGAGNAYITGRTSSTNFPTRTPLQAANAGTTNAFVAEVSAAGTALVYSTYLGGSGADWGTGIAVDSAGSAYITGVTNSPNFPTKNALQATSGSGSNDAFVTKINAAGTALVYSTYLGGSGADWGTGIAVDGVGNAYITGGTSSTNFPTQNALQAANVGTANAFVTKINAAGTALVYSTYLGGSNYDYASAIALDSAGDAYVTGITHSSNFPTHAPLQSTYAGGADAFVTEVSAAGTALVYSTYLGGSGADWGTGIAVDGVGNAYITGGTRSTNFPTVNPLQATNAGSANAFVAEVVATSNALIYSSYLGGSGNDEGDSIAVGSAGTVYVAGATTSSNFPISQPIQGYGGQEEGFLAKMNLIHNPSSGSSSTSPVHTVAGDFNGDGKRDIVSFYNYGNNQIKAWLFLGTSSGSWSWPTMIWDSGVNFWDWNTVTFLAGDFNGDGKTDIMAIHNEGGGRTTFWLFKGTGAGISAPVQVWESGVGNFDWTLSNFVAGDFNGDGKTDIMAFYNYGNSRTGAFLFSGTAASSWAWPVMVWDSGWGNFDWSRLKFVAGDFNGDGKADVMVFYNYGNSRTGAFLFSGTAASSWAWPVMVWDSGWGNFDWNLLKFVAGDFNGDGKADIMVFYNYGNSRTGAFLFSGTASIPWAWPAMVWDSGWGNWDWNRM